MKKKTRYQKIHDKVLVLSKEMSYAQIGKKLKMSKSMVEYYLSPNRKDAIRKNSVAWAKQKIMDKKKLKKEIESLVHEALRLKQRFSAAFRK